MMSSVLQSISSSSCSCPASSISTACAGVRQRRPAFRIHDPHTYPAASLWRAAAPHQPLSGWLPQPGICRQRLSSCTPGSSRSPIHPPSEPRSHKHHPPAPAASSAQGSVPAASSRLALRPGRCGPAARCRAVFTPVGSEAADMRVTDGGPGLGAAAAAGAGGPGPSFQDAAVGEQQEQQRQEEAASEEQAEEQLQHGQSVAGAASAGSSTNGSGSAAAATAAAPAAAADDAAATSESGEPASSLSDSSASDPSSEPVPFTLDGLSDAQKAALAEEWGYTRLGADLPPGAHPSAFSRMLPSRLFDFSAPRAVAAVALPLAAMAVGYGWLWYWHSICPLWQQLICAVLIGTAYTGLFKVAHECARFSFLPQAPAVQELLGSLLMLPSLYSFPCWRLGWLHHLLHLNQLGEDDKYGWHPLTKVDVASEILKTAVAASPAASSQAAAADADAEGVVSEGEEKGGSGKRQPGGSFWGSISSAVATAVAGGYGSWRLAFHLLVYGSPLKFLVASIGHWWRSWEGLDLRRFHPGSQVDMMAGWALPLLFAGVGFPAMIAAGGLAGFFSCYLAPWLVFHAWLSTLSLLQHTAPHIPFLPPDAGYDAGRAAISGTVTLRLPRPLELLLNDANYALPQIVAPGLPCYAAREAYEHMRERLLPYLTEARMNVKLLVNHMTKWQVYDEEAQTYRPLDEVVVEVDADLAAVLQEAAEEAAAE
ncbi:hypothetical protein Agub_g8734, partial [Astrephomene gubernaculifera]